MGILGFWWTAGAAGGFDWRVFGDYGFDINVVYWVGYLSDCAMDGVDGDVPAKWAFV